MWLPLRIALIVTHWQTLRMPMSLTSGWGAEGMSKSRMIAGLMLSLAAALFASGCAQTRGRVTRNATRRPLGGGAVVAGASRPSTEARRLSHDQTVVSAPILSDCERITRDRIQNQGSSDSSACRIGRWIF